MGRADQYRILAVDVRARASREPSLILKNGWENLAEIYIRLAKQSEESADALPTDDPIWGILDRSRS
jgi:hypothetical protein